MEGIEITKIVGNVDHLQVHGDIIDFYGVSVTPEDIIYSPNTINIGGLVLQVENGRFAFAQALQMFTEPKMQMWDMWNVVCENTKFNGPLKYGSFNVIGCKGFGIEKSLEINHLGNVVIGKNVSIRDGVKIARGTVKSTVIGDNNFIDNNVHIAHNVIIGNGNTIAAQTSIEGSCQIGNHNEFGSSVVVLRKVRIGNNNLFGSGCVVTKDTGDNGVYVGNPARKLRDNEA